MTAIFPLLVGLLELCAGVIYAWKGQWWLALAWAAYAVACVGLAMGSR
jgi:hypothetical protein